MKIYFAADHAGYELKNILLGFARDYLRAEVEDCGAHVFDKDDDYPALIAGAAKKLSEDAAAGRESRAVIIGASGQGEAMVANRFPRVRCALYYGAPSGKQTDMSGNDLDMLSSTRQHNDSNALALGARFLTADEAQEALRHWLTVPFPGEARHARRIKSIELQG